MKIEDMWAAYRKTVVSADASEIQISESRKAFYAGFISMFEVNNLISHPQISEARAIFILDDIKKQIDQFMKRIHEEHGSHPKTS